MIAHHPPMDMSLVTAMIGAQAGLVQLGMARQFERMNADQGASIAKLIDSANQNANALANVASNVGNNLDISA